MPSRRPPPATPPAENVAGDKPARRVADVPPELLERLHAGTAATRTLVEWLALDLGRLLESVLIFLECHDHLPAAREASEGVRTQGILGRCRAMARVLDAALPTAKKKRQAVLNKLAKHPSDTVRIWAAQLIAEQPDLSLEQRLDAIRPFAADEHFGVREFAWMVVRPRLAEDVDQSVALLMPWTESDDANVRRFAVEVLRPRGVWCAHIATLKADPAPARPLLDATKADPSRYVQLSVANWLNDASKSTPDWTREVCAEWAADDPAPETRWIINHATRTLRKQAGR